MGDLPLLGHDRPWPLLGALVAGMLVASYLVHRLVERPFAGRIRRRLAAAFHAGDREAPTVVIPAPRTAAEATGPSAGVLAAGVPTPGWAPAAPPPAAAPPTVATTGHSVAIGHPEAIGNSNGDVGPGTEATASDEAPSLPGVARGGGRHRRESD